MTRSASHLPGLAELTRDLEAALPPLPTLAAAAKAVSRHKRTLARAAARGELVVLAGAGGKALVPRASLIAWVAGWARAGA